MGFQKGQPRPAGAGRKPGSVNKTTAEVKAALAKAFEGLGGVKKLVEWGKENPGEFYRLWVKLLPTEVTGGGEGGEIVVKILSGASTEDL